MINNQTALYERVVSKGGKVGYICRNCNVYDEEPEERCIDCGRVIVYDIECDARAKADYFSTGGSDF